MNVDALVAIDVHPHAERNEGEPQDPVTGEVLTAAGRDFGGSPPQPTAQEVADDYRITPGSWPADFERLPIRDEVRPLVLKENAARLLGL